MFGACLEDASIGVRVASLKAACSFLQDTLPGVISFVSSTFYSMSILVDLELKW